MSTLTTLRVRDRNSSWRTSDELRWIDHIGRFNTAPPGLSERQMLANALEAAQRRQRWGDVDRKVVLTRLSARLRALAARECAS